MSRNEMIRAVAQTVALSALAAIISHHLMRHAYDNASQHHLWQEFVGAIEVIEKSSNATNTTATIPTIGSANATTSNETSSDFSLIDSNQKFYRKTLPKDLLFLAVISPLYYYWNLWLERSFPGRPRPTVMIEKGDEQSHHEEDVIQKWIAQGKIRRASLNWWNTFVKWILNLAVGGLWMEALQRLFESLWTWKKPRVGFSYLKREVLFTIVGSFFGMRPLSTLIGFIVIPAHQRIVFEAGADLVWQVFFSTFVGVMVPWFADTEFARMLIGNFTEGARKGAVNATYPQPAALPAGLPDEL